MKYDFRLRCHDSCDDSWPDTERHESYGDKPRVGCADYVPDETKETTIGAYRPRNIPNYGRR